jgi:hypothetical protein
VLRAETLVEDVVKMLAVGLETHVAVLGALRQDESAGSSAVH